MSIAVRFALMACLLLVTPAPASAAESPDSLLDDATERFADGDLDGCATLIGKAASRAQDDGDPTAERRVALALEGLLRQVALSAPRWLQRGASSQRALSNEQRAVVARVVPELDASRSGAFVSAPVLSRRLLYAATQLGDTEHVDVAVTALRVHAKSKGVGRSASVVAEYAEGLAARAAGEFGDARSHVDAAYAAAIEEGWLELAAHAGTEGAWMRWDAGEQDAARERLTEIGEQFDNDVAGETVRAWARAVRVRLPKDAPELLIPVDEATKRIVPAGSDPVTNNVSSGKAKLTPLGRAFKKMGRRAPLAQIERTSDGLELATKFKPKTDELVLYRSGDRRLDRGGLLVVVRGYAVGLEELKTDNYRSIQGAPRTDAERPILGSPTTLVRVRADVLLARGETWSVTKTGFVTVK